jgi:hypothetical protein
VCGRGRCNVLSLVLPERAAADHLARSRGRRRPLLAGVDHSADVRGRPRQRRRVALDAIDSTTGDAFVHHSLGQHEWEDIMVGGSAGKTSWTRRGYGVNTRSDTFLSAKGYGVNTRSETPLGADRASGAADNHFNNDGRDTVALYSMAWVSHTDPNGRTWSQTIDSSTGHATQRTAPAVTIGQPVGSAQLVTESWSYNTHGQVASHTDPLGHVTAMTYSTSGPQKGLSRERHRGRPREPSERPRARHHHGARSVRQPHRLDRSQREYRDLRLQPARPARAARGAGPALLHDRFPLRRRRTAGAGGHGEP